MPNYRRLYCPGATWFFTVVLAQRQNNSLLVDHIDLLRAAFRVAQQAHPFAINAAVVLPEHLHCIWTLPEGDTNYSRRWQLLKGHFSRHIKPNEYRSPSRVKRRERGIWQRRFWAHWITDQQDFNHHMDYIHWNPVKHGYVKRPADWPYSSFDRWVAQGSYSPDWGHAGDFPMEVGE
jgi:putative transposase